MMTTGALGKIYSDGEVIVKQGESGDSMYEILEGKVEVWEESSEHPLRLAVLHKGDFFGEMAIFEREARSATVRALGDVRALTIDKKNLLRRISEDPSLAFRILEKMSHRIRDLNKRLVQKQSEI
ncbi:MAG: cyclic nucleotide-binding domain-containing protein [Candidatus Aminicenantes bacterium]|nr:cyclic nucleotide-binding domain-containing protein [Candidatus Aminicenantes bacterium]